MTQEKALSLAGYQRFTNYYSKNGRMGGQELILPEIIAALDGVQKVYLPFLSSGTLAHELDRWGHQVWSQENTPHAYERPTPILKGGAMYFGTPTIVNGAPLFDEVEEWTKEKERRVVRSLVESARCLGYSRIVCGLGSGDISVEERTSDLGGGRVVAFKDFGDFQDWVLIRCL